MEPSESEKHHLETWLNIHFGYHKRLLARALRKFYHAERERYFHDYATNFTVFTMLFKDKLFLEQSGAGQFKTGDMQVRHAIKYLLNYFTERLSGSDFKGLLKEFQLSPPHDFIMIEYKHLMEECVTEKYKFSLN